MLNTRTPCSWKRKLGKLNIKLIYFFGKELAVAWHFQNGMLIFNMTNLVQRDKIAMSDKTKQLILARQHTAI